MQYNNNLKFINYEKLIKIKYEEYPFPHTVIDNFLNEFLLCDLLKNINILDDNNAEWKFNNPDSPNEYNKYAFESNYGIFIKRLFRELNSIQFIKFLEKLTGINNLITNNTKLRGAGIHRIKNDGYLQLHTDFNSYYKNGIKLDRRINLIIYMNPKWKEIYNGHLCLCDKEKMICVKKILPILNRCIIFNTTNQSVHGHPIPLLIPSSISRQSIAVYYYTKNINNNTDFEGDEEHNTIWYSNIKV